MGIETTSLVIFGMLSCLPSLIAMNLNKDDVFQEIFSWFLYWMSLLCGLLTISLTRDVLSRVFGVAPTTLETAILTMADYFYWVFVVLVTVLGALALLMVISIIFFGGIEIIRKGARDYDEE